MLDLALWRSPCRTQRRYGSLHERVEAQCRECGQSCECPPVERASVVPQEFRTRSPILRSRRERFHAFEEFVMTSDYAAEERRSKKDGGQKYIVDNAFHVLYFFFEAVSYHIHVKQGKQERSHIVWNGSSLHVLSDVKIMHTFDIKATFFMKPTRVICAKNGGKCFATCGLEGGRVGRVRRGGHLIFKKKMPERFAHGRWVARPLARGSPYPWAVAATAFCKMRW